MKIYYYEFDIKNRKMRMTKKVPYKRKKRKYIKEIRRRLGNITMRKNETKFKKLKKLYLKLDEADEQIESLKNVISYTISEFNKGKNLKISYLENFFDDEE